MFFIVVTPWVWRCSQVYGRFVALRGGLGLEIVVGNSDDTTNRFKLEYAPRGK